MMCIFKTFLSLTLVLFTNLTILSQPNPQFRPLPSNFRLDDPDALVAININYDDIDIEKQVFHLFLPDTLDTYPLVVYIHGGGFTGGNPGTVFNNTDRMEEVKFFLENGFAYASFGYRLIATNQADPEGVIKSLNDTKRALQYVRHYANDLNINPDKIALLGTSAGSGASLWLGTRSDMAAPAASDPVLKESTRVCAVVANGSKSTYDLYKWETEVYNNYDGLGSNFTLDSMANLLSFERFSNFYGGLDSIDQVIKDPQIVQYREDVDMLFHMSSDDPPIYVYSRSQAVLPSDDLFHHSFHGREINSNALAAGISEVKAYIPALSINTTEGESRNEFLLRHLNTCALATNTVKLESGPTNLKLYPNPASQEITIEWVNEEIKAVQIYSLRGRLMHTFNNKHRNRLNIPTQSLIPGMYLVWISNKKGNKISRKIIIE